MLIADLGTYTVCKDTVLHARSAKSKWNDSAYPLILCMKHQKTFFHNRENKKA